jgi:hypothetical protein
MLSVVLFLAAMPLISMAVLAVTGGSTSSKHVEEK